MKTPANIVLGILGALFLLPFQSANAQILKKLGKAAERAAERTVERRVERETEKKTDEVLDSIFEPGKKGNSPNTGNTPEPNDKNLPTDKPNTGQTGRDGTVENGSNDPERLEIYSKFDFVPGDKLLFFDDFSDDFIGDFPSKWNTNGTGEIITVNDNPQKWFELKSGYTVYYLPNLPGDLPDEYTIEFDVLATGLDKKTSSASQLMFILEDNNTFKVGNNYARASIPFCQYSPIGFRLRNRINNETTINNVVRADIREEVLNRPHISIAVNKRRFRLWVNEKKYVDVPQMIGENAPIKAIKFNVNNFRDGIERVFITNVKVAAGGVDLRRKLIEEGKVTTNGILFDSGSANIQPQSYGIIRQISQVLLQENNMKLKIVGHTDADGDEDANLSLSKKRADAVKHALIAIYNIDADRLITDGKGETSPIADNNTPNGKAQNRRVEFVKM